MGDSATSSAAPQHLRALEHANHVRLARADLKRRIGAGLTTAGDVVASPPPEVEGMTIFALMMSQRRWGRTRCRRVLVSLGVPENKRIGTLTARQRSLLAALLSAEPEGGAHATQDSPPRREAPAGPRRPSPARRAPASGHERRELAVAG
jgi:hypothetical protein